MHSSLNQQAASHHIQDLRRQAETARLGKGTGRRRIVPDPSVLWTVLAQTRLGALRAWRSSL